MRRSQKQTVRQPQAGRPGPALDPQNWWAAHYLARGHQWEADMLGRAHSASKPRTNDALRDSRSFGLRANLILHGIISRPVGSAAGRSSRVAREHPCRLSLVRLGDQAGSVFELPVAQGGQVCWSVRDGSGAMFVGFGDVEADEMMAMAL